MSSTLSGAPATPETPDKGPDAATANPSLWRGPYPVWLAGDASTALSIALAGFAIPLLALMVTGDPAQAGVIGAVGLVVRAAATLAGGVLADRRSRVALMIAGGLTGTALAGGFLLLSLSSALGFASLLCLNALMAARNGLFGVAASAALKDVVPAGALGRAQAANQARDAVITLSGAPLGGLLLGVGGWLVAAVMMLCQGLATLCSLALRGREAPALPNAVGQGKRPGPARRSARAELREALAWLWGRRDLRGALLVCTIVNLGFNAVVTTVLYSLQQAGQAPAIIGLVSTGIGAGMLLGALATPALVARVPAGALVGAGLVLVTAACAALPWLTQVWAIALALAVGMAGTPALNAALLGYFMVATPSRLMGRATSLLELFAMGAMPLAPLLAGLGLAWWGRPATLALGAGLCALSAALALGTRSLRRLPAEAGWAQHAAVSATSEETGAPQP